MGNLLVSFDALGDPKPKGSLSFAKNGGVYNPTRGEKTWRASVENAAKEAYDRVFGQIIPITDPVHVDLVFHFIPPKKGKYNYSARYDLDKLVRSVLDALTDVIYEDDKAVTRITAEKVLSNKNGVTVRVYI